MDRRSSRLRSGCARELGTRCSALFARLIEGMSLHPVGEPQWHQFPGGGITGLSLLKESHIACHTFPEYRSLCLNVFCCRPRPDWDFEAHLRREFGAVGRGAKARAAIYMKA